MKSIIAMPAVIATVLIFSCNNSTPKKDCDKYLGTWQDKKVDNPGDTLAEPGLLTVKKEDRVFEFVRTTNDGSVIKASCTCDHGRLISDNDLVPMENGKIYFKTRFFSKE